VPCDNEDQNIAICGQKESELDLNGEYLRKVVLSDLVYRQHKSPDEDSDIYPEELSIKIDEQGVALEDFYGDACTGDYFGEKGLLHGD
jgi:hypothetical protein